MVTRQRGKDEGERTLVAATEAIRCPIMEQQFTGVPPEGPPPEREIAAPRNGQRIKMKPTLAAAFCLPLHYVPLREIDVGVIFHYS